MIYQLKLDGGDYTCTSEHSTITLCSFGVDEYFELHNVPYELEVTTKRVSKNSLKMKSYFGDVLITNLDGSTTAVCVYGDVSALCRNLGNTMWLTFWEKA